MKQPKVRAVWLFDFFGAKEYRSVQCGFYSEPGDDLKVVYHRRPESAWNRAGELKVIYKVHEDDTYQQADGHEFLLILDSETTLEDLYHVLGRDGWIHAWELDGVMHDGDIVFVGLV